MKYRNSSERTSQEYKAQNTNCATESTNNTRRPKTKFIQYARCAGTIEKRIIIVPLVDISMLHFSFSLFSPHIVYINRIKKENFGGENQN